MDGLDLFRKLGSGAKFNFKRFHQDAEKLRLVKPKQKTESSEKGTADFFAEKGCCVSKEEDVPITSKRLKTLDEDLESTGSAGDQEDEEDEDMAEGVDSDEDGDDDDGDDPEPELHLLGSMKAKSSEDLSEADLKKKRKKQRKKTSAKLAELKQEQINHFRRQHRIHVHGTDVPDPVQTFQQLEKDYGMHHQVVENLQTVGFSSPTPIQMQAVPVMLQRREVLACAPTGSGKTAAFILPILHHLVEPRRQNIRALVLSPTRELAKQTYREFSRLGEGRGFRVNFIEKTSSFQKSRGKSLNKFDILVTTPNRLIFLLKQEPPMVNLAHVEWLVVDESDKLFEEGKTGFRDQLAVIYNACDSKNVRRAMFSATFAYEVEQWCKLNLDNVVQVYIGARNVASETVEQELHFVGSESGKLLAVQDIIRKGLQPPVLIFVQSKDRAKELFHELIYDGINVDVIHADRTQLQRDNIVKGFRAGKIWVLICTELMGRGIDFKGVNLVINYDFPNSAISYIHRIGRTGRAGRRGRAVTFFTENDAVYLRSIANIMREAGCPVPEYMLKINKPTKKERRKLAKKAPKRKTIRTFPKDEIAKARKRQKVLKSLERKGATDTNKAGKSQNSNIKDTHSKRKLSVERKMKLLKERGSKKENPVKFRQKKKHPKKSKTEQ